MVLRGAPARKGYKSGILKVGDLTHTEPWRRLLAANSGAPLPPSIPVFISQGTADALVRSSVTAAYVDTLCRHGSKAWFDLLQGVGHTFIARDTAQAAIGWIALRFADAPPPDDCRRIVIHSSLSATSADLRTTE